MPVSWKKIVPVLPRTVYKHRVQVLHIELAAPHRSASSHEVANPIASKNTVASSYPVSPNPSPTYIDRTRHPPTFQMKFLSQLLMARCDTVSSRLSY